MRKISSGCARLGGHAHLETGVQDSRAVGEVRPIGKRGIDVLGTAAGDANLAISCKHRSIARGAVRHPGRTGHICQWTIGPIAERVAKDKACVGCSPGQKRQGPSEESLLHKGTSHYRLLYKEKA